MQSDALPVARAGHRHPDRVDGRVMREIWPGTAWYVEQRRIPGAALARRRGMRAEVTTHPDDADAPGLLVTWPTGRLWLRAWVQSPTHPWDWVPAVID